MTIKEVRRFEVQQRGGELLPMIERATSSLPADLREEVSQELATAAIEGKLDLSDIARLVPFYRRKAQRQMADRFRFVSLDQPIGRDDGMTYAEVLAG